MTVGIHPWKQTLNLCENRVIYPGLTRNQGVFFIFFNFRVKLEYLDKFNNPSCHYAQLCAKQLQLFGGRWGALLKKTQKKQKKKHTSY